MMIQRCGFDIFGGCGSTKTQHPTARNLIEQPQDPNEWKEPDHALGPYPSFLKWEETMKVAQVLGLTASRVEQGALGHPNHQTNNVDV